MSTTDNNVHPKPETNNERQRLDGFVWNELHRSMSTAISEALSQIGLKPRVSNVTNNPQQGQMAQPTILQGRTMISFRLPKSIIAHFNLDEIDRYEDKPNGEHTIKTGRCFMKRLEGWTIERLQCKTCLHFDTIYRHVEEKKQFRSVTGALKYILYGEYPLIQDKIDINYTGEQSTTVKLAEEIHAKLVKVIREIISDAVSPLIKTPGDFAPQANETSIVPYSGRIKRKKMSHILLGELHTSFVIPEDSEIECFNIDQIERPDHLKKMYAASDVRQFCFNERRSGWIVERTKRENGVRDMFYYHSGLGKTLRSMTEVVNFILYEVYPIPANSRKEHKMTPEKGLYVAKTPEARPLTKEEEVANSLVVNFLRQSLHNIQIMCSHKSTAETGAGKQSQWKKDGHEKEKDTEEELPNCYEPLPTLQRQAQPNDSGGTNDEGVKDILEGTQGGEGSIERDNRKETTKGVEDSSKKVQLINEEQNNILKSLQVATTSLKDIWELSSSCEMIKMYTEYEKRSM